jgi:hypothetical protein
MALRLSFLRTTPFQMQMHYWIELLLQREKADPMAYMKGWNAFAKEAASK